MVADHQERRYRSEVGFCSEVSRIGPVSNGRPTGSLGRLANPTPPMKATIIDRLNAASVQALADPAVRSRLAEFRIDARGARSSGESRCEEIAARSSRSSGSKRSDE